MINIFQTPKLFSDVFEQTRYELVWKINRLLVLAFIVLCSFYLFEDIDSFYLFLSALAIPVLCLYYLFKVKKYQLAYHILGVGGFLFPFYSLNTFNNLVHYGDILWIVGSVTLTFFGLGTKIGRIYLLGAFLNMFIHVIFFLNGNIKSLELPISNSFTIPLFVEIVIALSFTFYIIDLFIKLYTEAEQKINSINKNLIYQNDIISSQNSEKEVLLKEIHHRVKNNLQVISSLLNLQSYSINDSKMLSVVKEGQDRIQAMALLHKKLYEQEDFTKIDFGDYVSQLVEELISAYKTEQKQITKSINIENIYFDIDTALPLGLIINELVSNALKHAFIEKGEISIRLKTLKEETYELIVEDSGVGFADNFNLETTNTLGIKLVRILCRQLNGSFSMKNAAGAHFIINFQGTELRKQID